MGRADNSAANALGLTTQVPVRPVYLTSGPNRNLKLGGITIELQHAPKWQLVAPNGTAGHAVRALAWLGPEEVEDGLSMLRGQFTHEDIGELAEARAMMPGWIAGPVSNLVSPMVRTTFWTLADSDRRDALAVAASVCGRPTYLLEKDVWVVQTLSTLAESVFGSDLVLKGGTSLSKAYNVIHRFSEDLDVTYNIRAIAHDIVDSSDHEPIHPERKLAHGPVRSGRGSQRG